MKKIFVTGSAGFIGFSLSLSLLKKGFKVQGYDSINNYYDVKIKYSRLNILKKYKNFSFTSAKLENNKLLNKVLNKFKPEIIVHLAAQAGVRYSLINPRGYLSSNIDGTFNILEAAHMIKVKHLLVASTSSVYGANRLMPFKEIDKADTQLSIYASTKKSIESLAHSYSSLWKTPTTILRFFTVYGPWGRPDMALFKFTKNIINKKKIDVYNRGEMYRDFTYIDDVVRSIELLINKIPKISKKRKYKWDSISDIAPFRIVNIGNEKKVYLKNFIQEIEKNLNTKAIYNYMPMQKGDVKETVSDTRLLKYLTKFKPKVNYVSGIKSFVLWYKNYFK